MTNQKEDQLRLRSFYFSRIIKDEPTYHNDFAQVGIWDNNYEYLNLEELKILRKFLNETIIKMTFKTITK